MCIPLEEMVDAKTQHYTEYIQCFVPLLGRKKGAMKKKLKQIKEQYSLGWSDYGYLENSSLRLGKYYQCYFWKVLMFWGFFCFLFLGFFF